LKETGGYEALRRHFADRFGDAGLNGQERVVIYEDAMDNGYGRSCRGWFIMNHLGHRRVTILHGGYQAWLAGNRPVTTEIPAIQKKTFPVHPDDSIVLTTEEMQAAIGDPRIVIVDARDHVEWVGTSSSPYGPDYAPRKGRIPGAIWLEWYQTMHRRHQIYWFKSPEELKDLFADEGITADSMVYLYCFKGARTSNVFMAMKMAGIRNVRNYFPSWNEWSRDPALPIETGYPTRRKPA
jgi:thiosulfate/3-mercaptopyruvate sulfurtransferase